MKYVNAEVVFQEVPNEITLAINISGCPVRCPDCHSKYLWEDIGIELNEESLGNLIVLNYGITCVAFMGGDADPSYIGYMARFIRIKFPKLKIAWYSGKSSIPNCIILNLQNFDYIKLGPYIKEYGPLNSKTTNQLFFKVQEYRLVNITKHFLKENDKDISK